MPEDNGALLREIRDRTVRIDERTERHGRQIGKLFDKQEETGVKVAAIEERTRNVRERVQHMERDAKRRGGLWGGGVGAALVALAEAWRWIREQLGP